MWAGRGRYAARPFRSEIQIHRTDAAELFDVELFELNPPG
jgi:hypothetical protein